MKTTDYILYFFNCSILVIKIVQFKNDMVNNTPENMVSNDHIFNHMYDHIINHKITHTEDKKDRSAAERRTCLFSFNHLYISP